MRTRFLFAIILAQFIFAGALNAADKDLPVLETKVKTAALFKNGLGFVIREGSTSLKDGWAVTRLVPDAVLGGIWFGCLDQDERLDEVVGFKSEGREMTEAISTDELLKANIGKRVVLYYDDKTLTGRVKAVPDNREPKSDLVNSYGYAPPVEYSTVVILETSQGDVAVNKNAIARVEFPDGMATSFGLPQENRSLKFRVSGPRSSARIGLSYLEKGVSWTPAYLVAIEDDKRARITMQATVINDAEDLEDAELFFVVGYPNFIYANVLSPMAMRQSITDFISSLSGGTSTGYAAMANVMAQSYAPVTADESGLPSYNYSAIPGLEGGYEEDLFLYNKQGVTLKKDERASYLVFSDRVEYKHVYEWEVPDLSSGDQSDYNDNNGNQTREQVWHSLRLTNSTQYPWTTAPAMAVRDSKPMAQDMITYTPKGGKVNLKLTVASDVKTDRQEYETDRQRDVSLYGYSYDLVTVKGELIVKNNKTSAITLDIRKLITGEVLSASQDGKIKKLAEGISRRRANSSSIITWEVPVGAGAEAKLTYSYKIYVSN